MCDDWYDDKPMFKDARERFYMEILQARNADIISLWTAFELVQELYSKREKT